MKLLVPLLLLPCLLALSAHGQDLPHYAAEKHLGVASCAAGVCHGSVLPRTVSRIIQNEYVVWSKLDRHRIAYQTLLTEQSKGIADKLGLPNAHEATICLDCHADNVPPDLRGPQFVLADGIGCEACHGGAENYLAAHTAKNRDRADTITEGLYPTEEPLSRARLCMSCHIGTSAKMATHDIMAAGHPRLVFELDTFGILQPAHYLVDNDYTERKWHGTNVAVWSLGQIAAARQTLSLIEGKLKSGGLFPELSLFDCHACHHPMSEERWRKGAGGGLPPGAVRLNEAHFVMLGVIAGVISKPTQDEFNTQLGHLHREVANNAAFTQRITRLRSHLDGLEAAAPTLDPAKLLPPMLGLVQSGKVIDYVVAEQAVMAIDMLLSATGARSTRNAWLEELYAVVEDEHTFDASLFSAVAAQFDASPPAP